MTKFDLLRIKVRMLWRLNRAYLAGQSILVRVAIDHDARTVTCVDDMQVFTTASTIKGSLLPRCPRCGSRDPLQVDRLIIDLCPDRWHDDKLVTL